MCPWSCTGFNSCMQSVHIPLFFPPVKYLHKCSSSVVLWRIRGKIHAWNTKKKEVQLNEKCKQTRQFSSLTKFLTQLCFGSLRLCSALMRPVSAGGPRSPSLHHPAAAVSSPSSPSLQTPPPSPPIPAPTRKPHRADPETRCPPGAEDRGAESLWSPLLRDHVIYVSWSKWSSLTTECIRTYIWLYCHWKWFSFYTVIIFQYLRLHWWNKTFQLTFFNISADKYQLNSFQIW